MNLSAPFRGVLTMPDSEWATGKTPVVHADWTIATIVWHVDWFEVLDSGGILVAQGSLGDQHGKRLVVIDVRRAPLISVETAPRWSFNGGSTATRLDGRTIEIKGGFTKKHYEYLISGRQIGSVSTTKHKERPFDFRVDMATYDLSAIEVISLTHCLRMFVKLAQANS